MVLLVNNLDEKTSQRRQDIQNFESMHMLFVICTCGTTLHSCYNFALMLQLCTHVTTLHLGCYNCALALHENALFFSQSDAFTFFVFYYHSP